MLQVQEEVIVITWLGLGFRAIRPGSRVAPGRAVTPGKAVRRCDCFITMGTVTMQTPGSRSRAGAIWSCINMGSDHAALEP